MARYRRREHYEDPYRRPPRRRRLRPGSVEDPEFGGRGWPSEDGPTEYEPYDEEFGLDAAYDEGFEPGPGFHRRRARRSFQGLVRQRPRAWRTAEAYGGVEYGERSLGDDAGAGPRSWRTDRRDARYGRYDEEMVYRDARPLSDRRIHDAVEESLFQDPWLDPGRIQVEVSAGVVRLTGEVDDFLQARFAWDDAWESAGVRGVIDHLTVRSDGTQDEFGMPQSGTGR